MRINRLLILLFSSGRPIITSAQFVERQELGVWPELDPVGAALGGVELLRGIGDTIGAGVENLFLNPQGSDSSKTEPQPAAEPQTATDTTSDGKTAPNPPPVAPNSPAEPVYKIKIDNSNDLRLSPLPEPAPDPPAILPSVNEGCDVNDPDCGKPTDQLIFTTSCAVMSLDQVVSNEVKALNQAIYDALFDMNAQNVLTQQGGPGLRTSRVDSICDVFFFAVPLTRAQIQEIEKKPGVRFVSTNRALNEQVMPASFHPEDHEPAAIPAPNVPRSRLQKRDRLVQDPRAGADLRFISTPPVEVLSRNYFYYEEAGEGSIIFAVGGAVNTLHDDFVRADGESSILAYGIKGMDASDRHDNVATCRVSKMVGRTHGVAKKAKVMVVNIINTDASFLDGLAKVCQYLVGMHLRQTSQGGYVMSMFQSYGFENEMFTDTLDDLLDFMIKELHLVVVVPSGVDESDSYSDIVHWPATSAGRRDIIVVGGVYINGRNLAFSRGGPFLTVAGPGVGKCADQPVQFAFAELYYGPDLAAAAATGLIAYWFSLPDIGPRLRRDLTNIPSVVKSFIELMSYERVPYGGFRAIWNMLPERQRAMGTEPDIVGLQTRDRFSRLRRDPQPHERNNAGSKNNDFIHPSIPKEPPYQ